MTAQSQYRGAQQYFAVQGEMLDDGKGFEENGF